MSDYRVALGHDVALASLTVMDPQPMSPGVQFTRRLYFGDGSVLDQGFYAEWIYNVVDSAAQLSSILTPMGLMAAQSALVTIHTRNQLFQYKRYNGTAIRPEANWENYFDRNVTIIIRNLVGLA
jgi:hypothetical protein